MRVASTAAGVIVLAFGLAAVAVATGCTSAKADPLEVTYYYLPG